MNRLRVALVGADGRMGRSILKVADEEAADIFRRIDVDDQIVSRNADVLIDFSRAEVAPTLCAEAATTLTPLVIGTTGHSSEHRKAIDNAATKIPVVLASNFSVGINVLFWLTEHASKVLGTDFDAEIIEVHHRLKRDAPSGTANTLAEILQRTREIKAVQHGRRGTSGGRSASELGIHSLRGGDVVGDHTVLFAGNGERIELTHRASGREIFARGALRAAHWITAQPPGLYSMRDVLGLA